MRENEREKCDDVEKKMGGQNKGWDVAGTIFECQQSTKTSFVDLEVESGATGVRFFRTRIRNRTHEQKTAPIKQGLN